MKKAIWIVLAIGIIILVVYIWQTRLVMYTNEKYGFSFSYNALYKEFYNVNTLISLQNYDDSIVIDAVATENKNGYSKDISELGEGYVNLLKIFNEDTKHEIMEDKTISVSNGACKARQVIVKIDNGEKITIEEAILIPAPKREITIVIRGTEKSMIQNEKEIDRFIRSIKIY